MARGYISFGSCYRMLFVLGTCFSFPHIQKDVIPTDKLIFFRGGGWNPPASIYSIILPYISHIFPIYCPYISHISTYISHICPIHVPNYLSFGLKIPPVAVWRKRPRLGNALPVGLGLLAPSDLTSGLQISVAARVCRDGRGWVKDDSFWNGLKDPRRWEFHVI